ncbi:MAG: 3'-5' exonuclease [Longimonas sp.]|uniref:3'-5' exonuclease n=1 Tax=Longimonas sp. TaxID=2039626 RepID=UPI003976C29A
MDVTVAIGDEFLDAFSALPKAQQKKTRRFIEKFRAAPKSSGINYEKINGAQDEKLRSVRIDQAYRSIILKPPTGNVFMILWVDHHDDAYQWARNRFFEIHPETGSLQVLPLEDGEVPEAATTDSTEDQDENEHGDLYAEYRDRELVRLGVPERLLPLVRSIKTEEDLDAMQKHLPEEAYEALFLLAAGYTQSQVDSELAYKRRKAEEVDTQDFASALNDPNTQRRFTLVDDDEELERMLDAPLEKWRTFLHPSQRRLVTMEANGPVRVLGGAGTGKTVVAMHRAVWLAENVFTDPGDRLLFTTFTRNLAADIEQNLAALTSEDVLRRIEVQNLDRWVTQFLRAHGYAYQVDYGTQTKNLWEQALTLAPDDMAEAFLRSEWEEIIQPKGIDTLSEYMRVSRIGRGTPLQRPTRKAIWPVFEEYRDLLEQNKLREREGAFRDARALLDEKGDILPYNSILVDEAQDMGTQAFKLIRQMIPGGDQKHDLFIVGDAHQRIYNRQVVLGHCGINIVGRGRKLRVNYRTTEENREWAVGLLQGARYDDLDGGIDNQEVYKSLVHGAAPRVKIFDSFQEETEAIVGYLRSVADDGDDLRNTCLVARTNTLVQQYRNALEEAGLETYTVQPQQAEDRSQPGVRLATMHRTKGLEFDRVIVAGVTEDVMPHNSAIRPAADDVDRSHRLKQERSLLYVAVTRSKREVIVTAPEPASPWIQEGS